MEIQPIRYRTQINIQDQAIISRYWAFLGYIYDNL